MENLVQSKNPTVMQDLPQESIGVKSAKISSTRRESGNAHYSEGKHDINTHRTIFSAYSESIAYAPLDSEELALGYHNRAVFLRHLKKYDCSIVDIDRALAITRSQNLKLKLLSMKIKCLLKSHDGETATTVMTEARECLNQLEDSDFKSKMEKTLSKTMNKDRGGISVKSKRKIGDVSPSTISRYSTELPSASDAVELRYTEKYGRHLVVNRNVPTGEILMIEEGYALAPQIPHTYIVCSTCSNFAWTGVPCDFCPYVIFCTEKCKNDGWTRFHVLECSILKYLMIHQPDPYLNNLFLVTLRIISRALQEVEVSDNFEHKMDAVLKKYLLIENCREPRLKGFTNGKFSSDTFQAVCSLLEHQDPLIKSETLLFFDSIREKISNETGDNILRIILDNENKGSIDLVIKLLFIIRLNSNEFSRNNCSCRADDKWDDRGTMFGHQDFCLEFLGTGIYPSISLMNHSCVPNVTQMFRDGKVIVITLRPLTKDDQIYVSYGPRFIDSDLESRQNYLKSGYDFRCECVACLHGWPIESSNSQDISANLFYQWTQALNNNPVETELNKPSASTPTDVTLYLPDLKKLFNEEFGKYSLKETYMKYTYFTWILTVGYLQLYGDDVQNELENCDKKVGSIC